MLPGPDIPWLDAGVPPIALAPCPDGWREVTTGDVTECDPYPEAGPAVCLRGEAHFPSEPGCRPIGDACPAGAFAEALPTDGPIVYVRADAPAGGDGSIAAPYAALSEVGWTSLAPTTTVALGKGTYEGTLPLRAGVRVIGACVAETVVTGLDAPVRAVVTVTGAGDPALVRNLSIFGPPEHGVQVQGGRALTLDGVLVEGARGVGLAVPGAGNVLVVTDTVVRASTPEPSDGRFGQGITVLDGGRLEATRLIVEDNHDIGITVGGLGTTVVLADVVVRDTLSEVSNNRGGRGINVQEGAQLDAVRLLVSGNRDIGVFAGGADTSVTLTDAVIRDTQSDERDRIQGRGMNVQGAAHLHAIRVLISGNRDSGVLVSGAGSEVILEDVVVRDTQPEESTNNFGRGLGVQRGARLEASRLLVSANHEVSVYASGSETTLVITDTLVRDTRPRARNLFGGEGIEAVGGARVSGSRVRIAATRTMGLSSFTGAVVDLSDVSIERVERAACAEDACPETPYGYAVAALSGSMRLTRFSIEDAATCGVFLSLQGGSDQPPSMDLATGVVSDSEIGACVQVADYDVARLSQDVMYRGNTANLDSTSLPVPAPLESVR